MSSTSTPASTAASPRSRPRIAAFAALSVAFAAAALWRPADDGLPLCTLKVATGVSCPGCGMTRGLAAIGRGEVASSVKYHAFAPIVAVAAVATWAGLGLGFVTGRSIVPSLNAHRVQVACLVFIGAFIAYWLVRLWMGTAP